VMLRMHLPEALSRQDYRSFPLERARRSLRGVPGGSPPRG